MPYVESDSKSNMSATTTITNGDRPSSLFLSHLKGYPVVNDAVNTYKTNPYGAKSLDLVIVIYDKFGSPIVPYLRTPYSIVAPYLNKADTLADSGLCKVDERFPVVKEDTSKITSTVKGYAFYPVQVAGQGRDYVIATYDDEYKKTGGDKSMVHTAKALLSTELRIAFEAYGWVAQLLRQKKEDVQQKVNEKQ